MGSIFWYPSKLKKGKNYVSRRYTTQQNIINKLCKPLPEKCYNNSFNAIKPNGIIYAELLGLPFVGEMYKRLQSSMHGCNGSYYCYTEQLINYVHAPELIKSVNNNYDKVISNKSDRQLICKYICDYNTWNLQRMTDAGLIRMIDAEIISKIYPNIIKKFHLMRIWTIMLVKLTNNDNNNFTGFG